MKINRYALLEPGVPYHIIGKANGSDKLFKDKSDYLRFRDKTLDYLKPVFHLLPSVEIPNHFHKIVIPKFPDEINWNDFLATGEILNVKLLTKPITYNYFMVKQLRRLLDSHSKYINKKYSRQGSLFINRIKRIRVPDNEYLIRLILYIHLNPEKHKLVKNFKTWPYSSYNDFLCGNETTFNHKITTELMGQHTNFIAAHEAYREKYKHIKIVTLHE